MRIDLGPEKCAVCRKPSEASVYCCNRDLDDPLWLVVLRHPFRSVIIGWMHIFGLAPGAKRIT